MGAILNNRDAETLILDVRTATTVGSTGIDSASGAFLVFPTSVVVDRPGGGQLVFPTHTSVEPGTLCDHDGTATLHASIDGLEVTGSFSWVLGTDKDRARPARACYRFRQTGREVSAPAWATQLPPSCRLWPDIRTCLLRQRAELLRRGSRAESSLLRQSEGVFRRYCRGPVRRALAGRVCVDVEDVVQRAIQTATRLLPLYASPRRPPSSWVRMLRFDGLRDLHREVTRLDWRGEHLTSLSRIRAYDSRLAAPDPALDAAEGEAGSATGDIAELLGYEQGFIALARLGDEAAIREIGDRLVATIRTPGETVSGTRRRCRDDFRATGTLLTGGSGGREPFAPWAKRQRLEVLDEALCASVGLESHARWR
jgi:DNA-directed RNA polymerase specialized sigma24 family protein